MTFEAFEIHPALRRALEARGYAEPTPVQAAVLEAALRGRDLLVSARTGSGKTVAFGLSLAEALLDGAPTAGPAGPPRALVVAPTRELAVQVQLELSWLLGEAGARVVSTVGGMDPRREARALAAGTHVVVGTPGRLRDHLERGQLDLSGVKVVVLDEADEMLDMGFREELEAILSALPEDRRTLLFSATIPRPIAELARRYTREPARVAATPAGEGHADIAYRAHLVAPREREHGLVNVLRRLDPARALVFCATREGAHHTGAGLAERGFEAVVISGEMTQAERTRALKSFRDGRARVLVATDVAARGLDIPGVDLVVHADVPRDAAALQHRSGRTGRAGKKGQAVVLAAPAERSRLERMLREASIRSGWEPVPTAEEIRARDEERLALDVAALAGEASEEELAAARRLLETRAPLLVAAALLRRERERLPAAEELPETARAAAEAAAPRAPRPARGADAGETAWFRVNLGRFRNADPKWVLPLLCRRGGVTRGEIGKIVVGERETRFQVSREAAAAFAASARRPDPRMPGVRIEPADGGGAGGAGPKGPGRPGAGPRAPAAHRPGHRPARKA
jgi:ATP-dependent RNA helicase DeaD